MECAASTCLYKMASFKKRGTLFYFHATEASLKASVNNAGMISNLATIDISVMRVHGSLQENETK